MMFDAIRFYEQILLFCIVFRHKRYKGGKNIYYLTSAGGWNKSHEQVENTPRVDSFDLNGVYGWSITPCGKNMIDVYFTDAEDGCIISVPPGIDEDIQLDEKPNGYGGSQLFFICPKCGARVRFLYWQDHPFPFVCRKCAGLNYRSQQTTKESMFYFHKGIEYARKYLVFPPWSIDGFTFMDIVPDKPRGMHDKTYMRHLKRFSKYQIAYIKATLEEIENIFKWS